MRTYFRIDKTKKAKTNAAQKKKTLRETAEKRIVTTNQSPRHGGQRVTLRELQQCLGRRGNLYLAASVVPAVPAVPIPAVAFPVVAVPVPVVPAVAFPVVPPVAFPVVPAVPVPVVGVPVRVVSVVVGVDLHEGSNL